MHKHNILSTEISPAGPVDPVISRVSIELKKKTVLGEIGKMLMKKRGLRKCFGQF